MNYWIYQGNPKVYDIGSYIATHPYIYWNSPKHIDEVKPGDTVFLWRSRINTDLIAIVSGRLNKTLSFWIGIFSFPTF